MIRQHFWYYIRNQSDFFKPLAGAGGLFYFLSLIIEDALYRIGDVDNIMIINTIQLFKTSHFEIQQFHLFAQNKTVHIFRCDFYMQWIWDGRFHNWAHNSYFGSVEKILTDYKDGPLDFFNR